MRGQTRTFAANPKRVEARVVNWLLFVLLSVIWGSSFILMKMGMQGLSPYQVASIRILSAGLVLLPFGWRSFQAVRRERLPLVFLSGILGTFFPAFLFCIAETRIDSSLAGILNALTPIFTLLIGALFFRSQVGWRKWSGVALGFLGLVMLILSGKQQVSFTYLGYASFILMATLLYGVNVNMVNRHLREVGSREIATVAFTMLIPLSLGILAATGFFGMERTDVFLASTAASAVLGVLGTAAASILFYMLLKRAGPVMSSMVTYGIPFVAIAWGASAGESIGEAQVACLVLILSGVYLANR
jgi:drug/metabolite transporter (DMT)-like permease